MEIVVVDAERTEALTVLYSHIKVVDSKVASEALFSQLVSDHAAAIEDFSHTFLESNQDKVGDQLEVARMVVRLAAS